MQTMTTLTRQLNLARGLASSSNLLYLTLNPTEPGTIMSFHSNAHSGRLSLYCLLFSLFACNFKLFSVSTNVDKTKKTSRANFSAPLQHCYVFTKELSKQRAFFPLGSSAWHGEQKCNIKKHMEILHRNLCHQILDVGYLILDQAIWEQKEFV